MRETHKTGNHNFVKKSLKGVMAHRLVHLGAKDQQPYRRILIGMGPMLMGVIELKMHLTSIGMGELTELQIDYHKATQASVVEEKVYPVPFIANTQAALTTEKELYEQVWSEPMVRLAKKYGVSDVRLRKRCIKLNIPVPPIGYWQKKEFGKAAPPPPLPPFERNEDVEFHVELEKKEKRPVDEKQYKEAEERIAFEREDGNRIHIPSILRSPHPLVAQTMEYFENIEPSQFGHNNGLLSGRGDKCLDIRVSRKSLPRALRIMNALIKAFDARGFVISMTSENQYTYPKSYKTCVSVLGETIEFGLREFLRQTKRELSPAEKKNRPWANKFEFNLNPSGMFTLEIKTWGSFRKHWADAKKQKLEDCLNDFIVGLVKTSVELRTRDIEREQEARRREEQQRLQEAITRQKREEEARLQDLIDKTSNWQKSKQIREYIHAAKEDAIRKTGRVESGSELDKWLTWANQQADHLDPLIESPPTTPNKDKL